MLDTSKPTHPEPRSWSAGRDALAPRARIGRGLLAVCVALLGVMLLGACGGGGSGDADDASSDDQDDAGSGGDTEEELLDWVDCMRGQGVDVPDPEVDADGNLGFPDGIVTGDDGGDEGGASIEDAQEVCGSIPEGVAGGSGPEDQSEFEDTVLEFAQCMRDHGVDMPDPEFTDDGGVGFGEPGAGPDQNDPAFQKAQEACQDILSGLGGDESSGEG
jgi:hypothetical protein